MIVPFSRFNSQLKASVVTEQITFQPARSSQEVLIAMDSNSQQISLRRLEGRNGCLPGLKLICGMNDLQPSPSSMKRMSATLLKLHLPNAPSEKLPENMLRSWYLAYTILACENLTSNIRDCINSSVSMAHEMRKHQRLQRSPIIESSSIFNI